MKLPKPSGRFVWAQAASRPVLRCIPLSDHARHVFTTRNFQLRGTTAKAASDWRQVAALVGVSTDRLARLRQVHGTRVVEAVREAQSTGEDRPEADAVIGREPFVGMAVAAADCVPLLLVDPRTGAVAAVHAGWRGTAAGAAPAAVAALAGSFGVRAADVMAAIGPSIGPCCYVVGDELPERFSAHADASTWFTREGELRLDLWRATRDQLLRAGLDAANVHTAMLCTACHTDVLCSYRKEGPAAGRMAAAIRPGP